MKLCQIETIELSEYVTAIIRLHCGRSGINLASLKQTEQKDEFVIAQGKD